MGPLTPTTSEIELAKWSFHSVGRAVKIRLPPCAGGSRVLPATSVIMPAGLHWLYAECHKVKEIFDIYLKASLPQIAGSETSICKQGSLKMKSKWKEKRAERKFITSKLNNSSRTKTVRRNRKKHKKSLSIDKVRSKVTKLLEAGELVLPRVFDDQNIEAMLAEDPTKKDFKSRKRAYTVPVTIGLFMHQVLAKDLGCKSAVTLFNQQREKQGLEPVSTNTTSYCEARARIPLSLLETLVTRCARSAIEKTRARDLWSGRRVFLLDGFVVSAPDTPANQSVYPQSESQQEGLGCPQIRVCIASCLHERVVTNYRYAAIKGKNTGEPSLFRQMFDGFSAGDIILADCNFESFRDLAILSQRGVDMVCDMNSTRNSPFRGRIESDIEDKQIVLKKPRFSKDRFTPIEWKELPATLKVRIIRYRIPGVRREEFTIITTLLDPKTYPARKIADLYKQRWECELDIRSIKSTMGLEMLTCHTPEMLERELAMYILAYNVICVTMCDLQRVTGSKPRDFSFKQARDAWLVFGRNIREENEYVLLLWSIAQAPLRRRPGRREPREVKRRHQKYPYLKKKRSERKEELAA